MRLRILAAGLVFATMTANLHAGQLVTMHDEKQAIAYCAGGGVVWLDLTSFRYVYKGSKFYGKGKNAAYVCEVQAIQAGGQPAPQK